MESQSPSNASVASDEEYTSNSRSSRGAALVTRSLSARDGVSLETILKRCFKYAQYNEPVQFMHQRDATINLCMLIEYIHGLTAMSRDAARDASQQTEQCRELLSMAAPMDSVEPTLQQVRHASISWAAVILRLESYLDGTKDHDILSAMHVIKPSGSMQTKADLMKKLLDSQRRMRAAL